MLDAVLEPDKAAVHVRLTGTHTGELFGMAPTNRSIDVRQMQIEWLRDGRICQHWRITQELDLLRQLGLDGAAGSGDPMHTTAR
jgi:predicted ester cyclase